MPNSEKILKHLSKSTQGLSLSTLLLAFPEMSRRTMQRYLTQLIDENAIVGIGQGRARLFKATIKQKPSDAFPTDIPLSPESHAILQYVNQSLTARKPVGYQHELLERYKPKQTHYLSKLTRDHLHKIGELTKSNLPTGTHARDVLNQFLIDLSWASSHLEGNTYSILDTKKLIEKGEAAKGKSAFETQMILNHKAAIKFIIENASEIQFNRYTLFNLHSLLSENLLTNPSDEGRIRQQAVEIGKSVYHPLTMPALLSDLFDLILEKAEQIQDTFEQAFFIMVHIPYLQPFIDINKRTSRLAANIPFIKNNLCPLSFLHVSEQAYSRAILGLYETGKIDLLRDLFIWAYERSTQSYFVIQQNIAKPSAIRLAYRDLVKTTIHEIVTHPKIDYLKIINKQVSQNVTHADQKNVQALILDELRRLHEGNLARYGLRLCEFQAWQKK